eukprot:719615-Ditylum_brightwellii.AAC.1
MALTNNKTLRSSISAFCFAVHLSQTLQGCQRDACSPSRSPTKCTHSSTGRKNGGGDGGVNCGGG